MSDQPTDTHPDDMPEEQVLPLDAWHREMGGRMVEFAGYQMPIQYTGDHLKHGGGIVGEHNWTREHAGLFDVSHMGQLLISGEGAPESHAGFVLRAWGPLDAAMLSSARRPSGDMQFATAVAAFGQKLRGDPLLADYAYPQIAALAGPQRDFWRQEFLQLVMTAEGLE